MKRYFLFMLFILAGSLYSQTTVGPLLNDYRKYIAKTSGGSYFTSGLAAPNSLLFVGRQSSGTRYRCFYQWTLPDNVIPDGANITQVKLEFDISRIAGPETASFRFAPIQSNLTSADSVTVFNETESPSSFESGSTMTNHFEQTFVSGSSPFAGWIVNQLAGNKFTLAIWLPTDHGFSYLHYISTSTVKLTITVDPQSVTADQVFENSDRITGSAVDHYEGSSFVSYTVPAGPFSFELNSTETFRADTTLWTNSQSQPEKYRTWNSLTDVMNHKDFLVKPDLLNVVSQFKGAQSVTVQTELLDGGSSGGAVEFKDPWLIDDADAKGPKNRGMDAIWHSNPSPFTISTSNNWYKGVFLNENPNFLPDRPYYSVGAPNPNTIGNFTSYFLKWSGSHASFQDSFAAQTPVVFTNVNATASARYKAHLGSSVSTASSTNSQRKYMSDGQSEAWLTGLVYESGNEIWLSEGEDLAQPLQPEYRVSEGTGGFSAPSVLTVVRNLSEPPGQGRELGMTTPHIGIVYQKLSGNNRWLWFREKRSTWRSPFRLMPFDPETVDLKPVIGRTGVDESPFLLAVWQGSTGLVSRQARFVHLTDDWLWNTRQTVPGSSPVARFNPSLTCGYNGDIDIAPMFLTFDDGNTIQLQTFNYGTTWNSSPVQVPGSVAPISSHAQVAADTRDHHNEVVHIVWEASLKGPPGVMYQRKAGPAWSTAYLFQPMAGAGYSRPTIANLSTGKLVMAWDNGSSQYRATYDEKTWTLDTRLYPYSVHSNLAIAGVSGPLDKTWIVSTGTSGPPYRLNLSGALTEGTTDVGLSVAYGRRVDVVRSRADSSGVFSFDLSQVVLKGSDGLETELPFSAVNDDDPALDESSAWDAIATRSVTLSAGVDSILLSGSITIKGFVNLLGTQRDSLQISMTLVDANTGKLLARFGSDRVIRRDSALTIRSRHKLAGLEGRDVKVVPRISGLRRGRADLAFTLVHVYTVIEDSAAAHNTQTAQGKQSVETGGLIPSSYALHQNFPNPFNPSTTFKFDLPEPATVSLVVYDLLGRQIAEVVSGRFEAGYHSRTWNATGLASSGVYFARFTAADASGMVKHAAITKLILIR